MKLLGEGKDWLLIHYPSEFVVRAILEGARSSKILTQAG
jgi:hypothetical protein